MGAAGLSRGEDDFATVRDELRARVERTWERLEDAVSELHALHEVPEEQIVERVRIAIDDG